MATKKARRGGGNGGAHEDAVVVELKRIFEEIRTQGARQDARLDALTAEVRSQGTELRAVRDLLVEAVAKDHRRIDALEVRVGALEAGKH